MKVNAKQRSIPTAEDFTKLREAYFAAKTPDNKDDEDVRKAFEQGPTGALVDFEVRQGEYGRGLFAKQFIQKGTPVWDCDRVGIFRTKKEWIGFLKMLPHSLQYDCVEWAYVEKDEGRLVVSLDLEQSALMNHGGCHVKEEEKMKDIKPANVQFVELPGGDDEWQGIAVADIQPGGEFLCDYSKFHLYGHTLRWFEDSWDQIVEKGIYY